MKKTFSIPDISCVHCVNTIKNELSEMDNVNCVEGNAEEKSITVEWDLPLSEEEIRRTLATMNYPAE